MAEDAKTSSTDIEATPSQQTETRMFSSRMGLNDNKAGMEGLDKDKINKIIMEATKGSRFYENEKKKDLQVTQRIQAHQQQLGKASALQLELCRGRADAVLKSIGSERDFSRYIVHIDMDAFYAAVEMRDNPRLRDVPMAVGGEGMLSTSNYLARRFGVRAAMPGFIARKLCPKLVIVPVNFSKYRAVSKEMQAVLAKYHSDCSPMSLDEAYLDFTDHMKERVKLSAEERTFPAYSEDKCRCEPTRRSELQTISENSEINVATTNNESTVSASESLKSNSQQVKCSKCGREFNPDRIIFDLDIEEAVREMRHRIHLKTRLTASAGIANNCLLAKICSDKNKPNGQFRVAPNEESIQEFLADLPIRKVSGIGKVSEKILQSLGVSVCEDFYTQRDKLNYLFSDTSFDYFMSVYLGISSNQVYRNEEGPKSKSVERTFSTLSDPAEMMDMCHSLSLDLAEDLQKANLLGRTITLKIKMINFEQKTKAQSVKEVTNKVDDIFKVASALLRNEMKNCNPKPLKLRLMGVRMSNFASETGKQTKLKTITKVRENVQRKEEHTDSSDCDSENGISFFETIMKERAEAEKANTAGVKSGIDAFTSNRSDSLWDSLQPNTKPALNKSSDITKFTSKRVDMWEGLSLPSSTQKPKKNSKIIPLFTLQDNDSNLCDPFERLEPRETNPAEHIQTSKSGIDKFLLANVETTDGLWTSLESKAKSNQKKHSESESISKRMGRMDAFVRGSSSTSDPFSRLPSRTTNSENNKPGALDKYMQGGKTSLWDDSCILEVQSSSTKRPCERSSSNNKRSCDSSAAHKSLKRQERGVLSYFSESASSVQEEVECESDSSDDILWHSGSSTSKWKYVSKSCLCTDMESKDGERTEYGTNKMRHLLNPEVITID